MHHHDINYVRLHRERAGLSHDELATLVGQNSSTAIGHYESGSRLPTLECALALELVLGERLQSLFSARYLDLEEKVVARAHALYQSLDGKLDPLSLAKRTALEAIPKRAVGNADRV